MRGKKRRTARRFVQVRWMTSPKGDLGVWWSLSASGASSEGTGLSQGGSRGSRGSTTFSP